MARLTLNRMLKTDGLTLKNTRHSGNKMNGRLVFLTTFPSLTKLFVKWICYISVSLSDQANSASLSELLNWPPIRNVPAPLSEVTHLAIVTKWWHEFSGTVVPRTTLKPLYKSPQPCIVYRYIVHRWFVQRWKKLEKLELYNICIVHCWFVQHWKPTLVESDSFNVD